MVDVQVGHRIKRRSRILRAWWSGLPFRSANENRPRRRSNPHASAVRSHPPACRAGAEGETEGIGYAMTAATLSEVSDATKWNPDPSFNVTDAILDNPEFVSALRVVLLTALSAKAEGKTPPTEHAA